MKIAHAMFIYELMQQNGDECEIRLDYSGRFMYGETTAAIVSDKNPLTHVFNWAMNIFPGNMEVDKNLLIRNALQSMKDENDDPTEETSATEDELREKLNLTSEATFDNIVDELKRQLTNLMGELRWDNMGKSMVWY